MNIAPTLDLAIVAADTLVRLGLLSLLADHKSLKVSESLHPEEVSASAELGVDIVIWDYDADLVELDCPILLLVAEDSLPREIPVAEVAGVLYRTAEAGQLVAALRAIDQGLSVLEPDIAKALLISVSQSEVLLDDLTAREFEVLGLLCEGLSNKAIAKSLVISEHTVKFHINALMSKFAVQNRTELVVQAIQNAIVIL